MPDSTSQTVKQTSTGQRTEARWYIPEAMAAWFVPGLGHYLMGEKKRGIILLICISSLWFGGLLIGGPGIVNWHSQSAPIVRLGQYGLFQTFMFEWVRNNYMQPMPADITADEKPNNGRIAYRQSFNRLEEQGVLYAAIAGLMNVLAIIDVIHRRGPREGKDG